MRSVPRIAVQVAAFHRRAGELALASAAVAVGILWFVHPDLGTLMGYLVFPMVAAAVTWVVVGAARLRLVDFLPGDSARIIPGLLQPWARFWHSLRLALLGAMLLLLAATLGMAAGGPVALTGQALVYVVTLRIFMDLVFEAAFNLGIISRHNQPR